MTTRPARQRAKPRKPKKASAKTPASPKTRKTTKTTKKVPLDAAAMPALSAFAKAYLHRNLTAEYADAVGAVTAFCLDAPADERAALASDLGRLLKAVRSWPAPALARYFTRDLGAAWAPASVEDVETLATVVRDMG